MKILNRDKSIQLFMGIGIVVLFIIFSVASILPFIETGKLVVGSDASFHLSRAEEIYLNLKQGSIFTFIAAHTFSNSGVGSFLFYPTVFIYPLAMLRFIFNPINSFYIWLIGMLFLSEVIAYISMQSFAKNKIRSISFALIYTFSAYHLYLGVLNLVLGEFIAGTFLPLVFVGFYHVIWGDYKKWYLLAIGMTLICYSHVLTILICFWILVLLCIVAIIVRLSFTKSRFFSLVKSVIATTLLSFWIIWPLLTDLVGKNLVLPKKVFYYIANVGDFFTLSIRNGIANQSIGIILVTTLLVGWYASKNSTRERIIYMLGSFLALFTTELFPWSLFLKTSLTVIQFPYRLLAFASLFLAVTGSLIVKDLFTGHGLYKKIIFIAGFGMLFFLLLNSSLQSLVNRAAKATEPSSYLVSNTSNTPVRIADTRQVDKYNYNSIFTYMVLNGETDYYHAGEYDISTSKKAQSIVGHIVYVNNKYYQKEQPQTGPNKISYSVKVNRQSTVNVPVIAYEHTIVYVNGKAVKYSMSNRGTVQVEVNKGNNYITVRYKPSVGYFIALMIAIVGWLLLILLLINKKFKIISNEIIDKIV